MSKSYYHEELGIEMRGFGIYDDDDILRFFCDKSKADNLRERTVDDNAHHVVIPVVGTAERNNNYHLAMKTALQNHTMRFIEDELTVKEKLAEDPDFARLSSHDKMRRLIGHMQIDIMVIDEAIKLQQVINKGFVALVAAGRNKRDRIVACEYANYFYYLKELEMIKKNQKSAYRAEDFRLWGNTN